MKSVLRVKKIKKYRSDSADVDFDISAINRDIVKKYISLHFGELQTCSVGTWTNLKLRSAIKDFGAVKGFAFKFLNFITSFIDNQLDYTFKDFVSFAVKNKDVYKFFQENNELVHAIKYALDQPKAKSIHASAVLVLPKTNIDGQPMNIFNWMPIIKVDDLYVSEWTGKYTDLFGALKEDVLGLSTLDQLKHILHLIRQNTKKDIDLLKIDYEDQKVYKLFQNGFNENVFQFTGNSIKNYTKRLKPTCFYDLAVTTAICRPATMEIGAHMDYVQLKHGKKEPHYDYGLQSVTEKTFGIMIFQEQMMQAVMKLGNFTEAEADTMRTAVKKFSFDTMIKFKDRFIKGALENKCPEKEAYEIWDKIISFSGYTFNAAHSVAYSMLTYQTQWLKAHYPLEFWTTAIQFAKEEEIPAMISEMNKLKQGIIIKPPDVNNSEITFGCSKETNSIYWSLAKIKGLGTKTVEAIIIARGKKPFTDLTNFTERITSKVNKGHIEKMIMAGCFDQCEQLEHASERLMLLKKYAKMRGYILPEKFDTPEVRRDFWWVIIQKELTGFGNINFRELIMKNEKAKKLMKIFVEPEAFFLKKDYDLVCAVGQIVDLFERRTKKGDPFIIATLQYNNENIKVLLWNDFVEANVDFLESCMNKMIYISGKVRWDAYNHTNALHVCEETEMGFL